MSAARRQGVLPSNSKVPFDCPGCGIRLMMDPAYPATSGPCPSCGGWIRAPRQMRAMPIPEVEATGPKPGPTPKMALRARPMRRMEAHGVQTAAIFPDVACDSSYEARKEMKGFYRFLGAIGGAACVCLAVILWVTRS